MKVLHAMNMIFPVQGIINQMRSEQLAADANGLDWDSKIFSGFFGNEKLFEHWMGDTSNRLVFKLDFYRWLFAIHESYDVILLRHTPYDPLEYLFLKKCKRPVFLVLHTIYVNELSAKGGARGKLQALGERLIGPLNFRKAFGIISVTEEIGRRAMLQIGKAVDLLTYPNGIFWQQSVVCAGRLPLTAQPQIVLVASKIAPWHGVNKLIDSIRASDRGFVFHFIGEPSAELQEFANQDSRIVLHGCLEQHGIAKILSDCTVGISSLAISSLGMKEACPLKTREYLLHGLPVYGAHREPFPETFHFYRQGESTIEAILDYCHEMRGISREKVAELARPYIDKSRLLLRLHSEIALVLSREGKS